MDVETPNKFTITITGDESGIITAHDSRSGETEKWAGVAIILGSVSEHKFATYFWGEYSSITYGFWAGIMQARNDMTEIGKHHREAFGRICRMIMNLYDRLRKAHEFTAEGVLERWDQEDKEKAD